MPRKQQYRYKGVLAVPYQPPGLINAAADESDRAFALRYLALCNDCGVSPEDPDAERIIMFTLALRHVPGFFGLLESRRRGAPGLPRKTLVRDVGIVAYITSKTEKGQSARQAALHLSRKYPTLGSASALETRFRRTRKMIKRGGVRLSLGKSELD
jgi:hypothetical protein